MTNAVVDLISTGFKSVATVSVFPRNMRAENKPLNPEELKLSLVPLPGTSGNFAKDFPNLWEQFGQLS